MHVRNHQNDHTDEGFIFAEGKMRAALADQKLQKKIKLHKISLSIVQHPLLQINILGAEVAPNSRT